ncbi:phage tail protein [Flavobacterium sp. J27]|uniref:phage tail protein n=1 Tax=Flavobacterium sp. J27 TaxID=2060419 RepID=UPI00102FC4B5|nr:phage tail protein [Flavobacterium sp. J27]
MKHLIDFNNVSEKGLASSPVVKALAGLRANEARYFKNKYHLDFTVTPASESNDIITWVHPILKEERDIVITSKPLETARFLIENMKWVFIFYESGLAINIPYTLEDKSKRAVGFKLSEGMEIPEELATKFKFARQKSKLAGIIRGSYFVIKGDY